MGLSRSMWMSDSIETQHTVISPLQAPNMNMKKMLESHFTRQKTLEGAKKALEVTKIAQLLAKNFKNPQKAPEVEALEVGF